MVLYCVSLPWDGVNIHAHFMNKSIRICQNEFDTFLYIIFSSYTKQSFHEVFLNLPTCTHCISSIPYEQNQPQGFWGKDTFLNHLNNIFINVIVSINVS